MLEVWGFAPQETIPECNPSPVPIIRLASPPFLQATSDKFISALVHRCRVSSQPTTSCRKPTYNLWQGQTCFTPFLLLQIPFLSRIHSCLCSLRFKKLIFTHYFYVFKMEKRAPHTTSTMLTRILSTLPCAILIVRKLWSFTWAIKIPNSTYCTYGDLKRI